MAETEARRTRAGGMRAWATVGAAALLVAAACTTAATPGPTGTPQATTPPPAATTPPAETPAATPAETPKPSGKIVISNWDLYMPEDLIPNFTAETGIEVELALHTTNEDIMGKIEAANGGGFDIVFVSAPFAEALAKRGWAAKLDKRQLPNAANLAPEADRLEYDPGNQYSIPYTWGTTGLCYRSDLVSFTPDSWNDLLTPRDELKGKITMLGTDRWLMLPALKVLGYSINTTDPAELEAAKQLLLETKKSLLAYDDITFYAKLVSGEAYLVEAWDGWCNYGIAENPDIKWVVPKEGSDLWSDTMVILESSQNKPAAHAFLDYVLRPLTGKAVAELVYYKVPNPNAMRLVDPALLEQFSNLAMTADELSKFGQPERDLGDAAPLWARIVAEITAGG